MGALALEAEGHLAFNRLVHAPIVVRRVAHAVVVVGEEVGAEVDVVGHEVFLELCRVLEMDVLVSGSVQHHVAVLGDVGTLLQRGRFQVAILCSRVFEKTNVYKLRSG